LVTYKEIRHDAAQVIFLIDFSAAMNMQGKAPAGATKLDEQRSG